MTSTAVERMTTGWTADAATFGARLALVRQRMAWGNVKEAAIACGLPPESWRTWERDNVSPRHIVTVAKQISGRSGCDYLWLLLGPDRGEGGGGMQPNERYHPLDERMIPRRTATTVRPNGLTRKSDDTHPAPSAVRPSQRRPQAVGSPNRPESVSA